MRRISACLAVLWTISTSACPAVQPGEPCFTFRHDDVLGTSCEFMIAVADRATAEAAEAAALAEIDRIAAIASTYSSTSEVTRWLTAREPRRLSAELTSILRGCDRWREASGGGFHPGVAAATTLWRQAEQTGIPPDAASLAAAAVAPTSAPWRWEGDLVTPTGPGPLALDALAKGEIIEAACRAAAAVPGVSGVVVNIGGDLASRGEILPAVTIAGLDRQPLDVVPLTDAAIATSGGGHRGFTVAGRRWSHLIDPRSARPVEHVQLASVVADSAAEADALATICSVLEVPESLRLIASVPGAACLILDREGFIHVSRDWPGDCNRRRLVARPVAHGAEPEAKPPYELVLDLEINRPAGGRSRRPYVAAWVEDGDGYPVKTLLLWVQADGPGPRWIPDLRRWYRADRLRRLAEDADLVATISEPTRQPGRHSVIWDCRDNAGQPLEAGEYTICIEAAREHGTYQFDRRTVTLGTEPFREVFDGNAEIKSATLNYRAVEGR